MQKLFGGVSLRWSALGIVVLWALYQGFWNLGGANLTTDEPVYLKAGLQYVHGDFAANREHPPTAKYLLGLAQLVLGHGALSGRVIASALVFAAGIVLFLWLRRETGWWTALAAAGLWWLLPREVGGSGIKFDRFAVLEPFMVSFAIFAFAAGWAWYRRAQWWWSPLAGALMALSVTSKVSTAVLLPCFLVLGACAPGWRRRLIGAAGFVGAFGVVAVAVYLPMGMRSAITYMIEFQAAHNENGHEIAVLGTLTAHPPWWTNLWFNELGFGPWLTIAVAFLAVVGLFARPRPLVAFVGSALALLLVFYLGITHIALPSYYYAWIWCPFVLAALGIRQLLLLGSRGHALRILTSVVLALGLVVVAHSAVATSMSIAREHPTGLARVTHVLHRSDVHGKILVAGYAPFQTSGYLGKRARFDLEKGPFAALLIGTDGRYPPDARVAAFIAANADRLTAHDLNGVLLYIPSEPFVLNGDGLAFVP